MLKKHKVVFIHNAKRINYIPDIMLLPIGLPALADFLIQHNIETEIIHYDLELVINKSFDIIEYLQKQSCGIICFDLHWHYQSFNVIETIIKIKHKLPNYKVILGGYTASFFAKEIITQFSEVDFIIKGDSEIPLLKLINAITAKDNNYAEIPNLVWNKNGTVIQNPHTYITNNKVINNLNYSSFYTIKNHHKYNEIELNIPFILKNKNKSRKNVFYYNCGRGCPVNCSFCGGSNISQKIINKRGNVIWIDQDSVIRDLNNAHDKYHLNIWFSCFDPYPNTKYYIKLFKKIRENRINLGLQFECWSIPTINFVNEFAKTFNREYSCLIISPECGSEFVRKKNKGYYYSNRQFFSIIKYILKKRIKILVHFTAGLPFETEQDIFLTILMINSLKKVPGLECCFCPIEFEPCSPWFNNRNKYCLKSDRYNFNHYVMIHKKKSTIGYETENMSEDIIYCALKLFNAEYKCKRYKSLYLEYFVKKPHKTFAIELLKLHALCAPCEHYNECFK